MSESINQKDKKNRMLKILGFSTLFAASVATAVAIPLAVYKAPTPTLNNDFSLNTYIGNKNRIDNFVNVFVSDNYYSLNDSAKVFGKDGFIGQDGVQLSSNERSLITVKEAYENNLFKLELRSTFLYELRKNNINYELAYVKPYNTDSSYPLIGIKFFYGENDSYYERYYEYRDVGLYGFKKSPEHSKLDYYVNLIKEDPNKYFGLKSENYPNTKIGDPGLYAKNIKSSEIDLNTEALKELRKENYWLSISSVQADKKNPSLLKITFSLTYDDGNMTISTSYNDVYLGQFDIEDGVDDPESKIELFYNDNKDWINNLNQYFVYTKENKDDKETYSLRTEYENGRIEFKTNYSVDSKLEDAGLTMHFKTFEQEKEILKTNPNELSVFNNEFDSTTPSYRIYFTSYEGTPLEYTKSFVITGTSQEGEFKKTIEQKQMNALDQWMIDNGKLIDDLIELNWNTSNPLGLSEFFTKKQISYSNNKYNIPFAFIEQQYKKYIDRKPTEFIDKPFDSINSFVVKSGINLDTSFAFENETFNIQDIINNIVTNLNNKTTFEDQIDEIKEADGNNKFLFNFSLGNEANGNIFTNLDFLEIDVTTHFQAMNEYNDGVVQKIADYANANTNNVFIKLNDSNGRLSLNNFKKLFAEKKYRDIFSYAFIKNIPDKLIVFPNLQSEIKVEIDFDWFSFLNYKYNDILNWNENQQIEIHILIKVGSSTKTIEITKTIKELISN